MQLSNAGMVLILQVPRWQLNYLVFFQIPDTPEGICIIFTLIFSIQ